MDQLIVPPARLAGEVAARIAVELGGAIAARGRALLGLSGGSTPVPMFHALAGRDLDWDRVDVVQVDERVVDEHDPERNLTPIRRALVDDGPLPPEQLHPMPVTAPDLVAAAADYGEVLARLAPGDPPVLDVVQLGLGPDGHTASLVPGDPVVDVSGRSVALTGAYHGLRRMTLTLEVLDAARRRIWMVAGDDKVEAVARLLAGDRSIPAGRVERDGTILVATPGSIGDPAP